MKKTLNPFNKDNKLSPLNAPGLNKVGGIMGRAPGMQAMGNAIPGAMQNMIPGGRGMFKPGLGPSQPPTAIGEAASMPAPPPMIGDPAMMQGPPPQAPAWGNMAQGLGGMSGGQRIGPSSRGMMGGLRNRMMQMRQPQGPVG